LANFKILAADNGGGIFEKSATVVLENSRRYSGQGPDGWDFSETLILTDGVKTLIAREDNSNGDREEWGTTNARSFFL